MSYHNFLVTDTTPPSAPTVTVNSVSRTQVSLTWTAAPDNVGIARYTLYRNGALAQSSTALYFQDVNLILGTVYNYLPYAVDLAGDVSTPSAVSATTLPPPR